MPPLEVEVALRRKNQLTLPELIARQLGVEPGDRLVMMIDESQPETAQLRRLRRSYAGIAADAYGTPTETEQYLRGERESWDT